MPATFYLGLVETLCNVLSLVGQTILLGVLFLTFPISIRILLARRDQRTSTKVLLGVIIAIFVLSFIFWAFGVGDVIFLIVNLIRDTPNAQRVHRDVPNAVVLINFVVADGVVVWRAWVINREKRLVLFIAIVFLILAGLMSIMAIVVRSIIQAHPDGPSLKVLNPLINTTQTALLGLSLLTNIIATIVIWIKAWEFKTDLRALGYKRTPVERILVLLVESGMLYVISGIIVVISTVVRLPFGTLGDVVQPIHAMLSGVYPTLVIILVSQRKSLQDNIIASKVHHADHLQRAPTIQSGIRFREITVSSEFAADSSARTPDSPRLRRGKGAHENCIASNHSRISAPPVNAAPE